MVEIKKNAKIEGCATGFMSLWGGGGYYEEGVLSLTRPKVESLIAKSDCDGSCKK